MSYTKFIEDNTTYYLELIKYKGKIRIKSQGIVDRYDHRKNVYVCCSENGNVLELPPKKITLITENSLREE